MMNLMSVVRTYSVKDTMCRLIPDAPLAVRITGISIFSAHSTATSLTESLTF